MERDRGAIFERKYGKKGASLSDKHACDPHEWGCMTAVLNVLRNLSGDAWKSAYFFFVKQVPILASFMVQISREL